MTWTTHTLFGISALWLLAPLPPQALGYDLGTLAACAALGALLPDLDASESKIKHFKLPGTQFKPFLLPAQVIHRSDQHRGLLHSLWGLSMAGACVLPLAFCIGWAPVTALLLGYASHLIAYSYRGHLTCLFESCCINFVTTGNTSGLLGIIKVFAGCRKSTPRCRTGRRTAAG